MADLFDVLADSTRRDLLSALRERTGVADSESGEVGVGELSVGELVGLLGLSQPTVSKHLRVLRDNHLVRVREVGQHRLYRLDPEPLEAVRGWLASFLGTPDADTAIAAEPSGGDELSPDCPAADRPAVFAAFTAPRFPLPIRRLAASLQNSAATGAAWGQTLAGARDRVRSTRSSVALAMTRRSL